MTTISYTNNILKLAVVVLMIACLGTRSPICSSTSRSTTTLCTAFSILDDPEQAQEQAREKEQPRDEEKEEGIIKVTKKSDPKCKVSKYNSTLLGDPCELDASIKKAPEHFSLIFPTSYGRFTATCSRARAPIWADRVYKLASNGYYNNNYFFRVIPGRYIQFGTNGNPQISNMYNYTSTSNPNCSILDPQPPFMSYCMLSRKNDSKNNCKGVNGLSNDFGTIAMSTSYNQNLKKFPNGVTWNATAELFINIGNNPSLDSNLFVPICNISKSEMETVVTKFPSFGEVSELGGDGPSLGKLYEEGNAYIESNPGWKQSMAITGVLEVCS